MFFFFFFLFFATLPIIFFSFGHNLFFLLCNTNCTMLGLCLPCCPCDVKPCPAENCHLTGMLSLQKLTACVTIILTLLSQRADNRKSTKKKKRRETNSSICVFVTSWVCRVDAELFPCLSVISMGCFCASCLV